MNEIILGVASFALCVAILAFLGVVLTVMVYWLVVLASWIRHEVDILSGKTPRPTRTDGSEIW